MKALIALSQNLVALLAVVGAYFVVYQVWDKRSIYIALTVAWSVAYVQGRSTGFYAGYVKGRIDRWL